MKTWEKISAAAAIILLLGIFSCEDPNAPGSDFTVTVSGSVTNSVHSGQDSVVITLSNPFRRDTTNSEGVFNYSFTSNEKNTVEATLSFRHINFSFTDTTIDITYNSTNKSIDVGEIQMKAVNPADDSVVTGRPSSRAGVIAFKGSSVQTISVRGAGATDATNLIFEVRDSLGIPVDATNSAVVHFKLVTRPDSLTYLNKTSAMTNAEGQVAVQLTAGNKSGLAQIQSYAYVKRQSDTSKVDTIKSPTVSITIAGGLPVPSGFTMGAEKYNIPGGVILNYRDRITAVVGDTFGNPVQQGTKVYFSTTGGVIQPEATTDKDGIVTVELITGDPQPANGVAIITAQVGTPGSSAASFGSSRNNLVIKNLRKNIADSKTARSSKASFAAAPVFEKSIPILFSRRTLVAFNDTTFTIPVGATQEITYNVSDVIGNPLTSGSTISVVAEPASIVDIDGDKNIVIPDTFGPYSQFKVRLTDKRTTGLSQSVPVTVTVNVTSENGSGKSTISGYVLGTGGITVDSSQVGRIELANPLADTLYVSGNGVSNSKDVEFIVYNIFGLPAKNVPVNFGVTKGVGGGEYVTPGTALTDNQGKVKTSVVSGVQYGIIHVQATAKRDTMTIASNPKIFHIKVPKGSRLASQISFEGISATDIDIAGVGGTENSTISYVVKDSFGIPIDKERRAFATFNMRFEAASVGGGTFPVLLPSADSTDDNGKLTTRVVSGTQAGVVTVEVVINLPGRPAVRSLPVKITIHAGFADQGHFSLIPRRFVFPGSTLSTTSFTVVVGDTFSNPVDIGTAIYFNTQAGIIQTGNGAYTDINGTASVNLMPVNPTPDADGSASAGRPTFDTSLSNGREGYHWVVARTQGRYGLVTDSVMVVQAVAPIIITGIPDSVAIDSASRRSPLINFTVKDARGNPLPDGTTISAIIIAPADPPEGYSIATSGNLPTTLPVASYARFPGTDVTDFSFRVVDESVTYKKGLTVSVHVTVSSDIGSKTVSFTAQVQ